VVRSTSPKASNFIISWRSSIHRIWSRVQEHRLRYANAAVISEEELAIETSFPVVRFQADWMLPRFCEFTFTPLLISLPEARRSYDRL
jgi:hypothetical protein